ncbi:MAG: hypothetical protein M5U34_32515 [Chloroflexi bacterium]|nr:hypothetical protein [Chloroflexota bacterium]
MINSERAAVVVDLAERAAQAGTFQHILINMQGTGTPIRAGTSMLANEHWDDSLPVSVNGRPGYGAYYTAVGGNPLPVTFPDSPEKAARPHQLAGRIRLYLPQQPTRSSGRCRASRSPTRS